jgi:UDP-GlcNAc:undecaprenyl-phosphate GlcNAc-1-phosphate transferase
VPAELRLAVAVLGAAVLSCAAVPLAIRVANRTGFYDRPRGYKAHLAPTPYLGGAAMMLGVLPIAALTGSGLHAIGMLLGGTLVLFAVGTIDDRRPLPPASRVLLEAAIAAIAWHSGLRWSVLGGGAASLVITIVWVVGIVNALNLLDNMDGTAGATAGVAAAGIAVIASARGDYALAAVALSVTGGCVGFLRWNLANPARIFLGDGGSLPLGFLLAGTAMALQHHVSHGIGGLAVGVPLLGIPILDTSLVSFSRWRRGVSLIDGGRDHLTHRLLPRLGSPRRVAAAVGCAQAALALAVLGAVDAGHHVVVALLATYLALALATIAILEHLGFAATSANDLVAAGATDSASVPFTEAEQPGSAVALESGIVPPVRLRFGRALKR